MATRTDGGMREFCSRGILHEEDDAEEEEARPPTQAKSLTPINCSRVKTGFSWTGFLAAAGGSAWEAAKTVSCAGEWQRRRWQEASGWQERGGDAASADAGSSSIEMEFGLGLRDGRSGDGDLIRISGAASAELAAANGLGRSFPDLLFEFRNAPVHAFLLIRHPGKGGAQVVTQNRRSCLEGVPLIRWPP